ncbi:hypothetical protein STEG23_032903 [Scotinomys teguina]
MCDLDRLCSKLERHEKRQKGDMPRLYPQPEFTEYLMDWSCYLCLYRKECGAFKASNFGLGFSCVLTGGNP